MNKIKNSPDDLFMIELNLNEGVRCKILKISKSYQLEIENDLKYEKSSDKSICSLLIIKNIKRLTSRLFALTNDQGMETFQHT